MATGNEARRRNGRFNGRRGRSIGAGDRLRLAIGVSLSLSLSRRLDALDGGWVKGVGVSR